MPSMCVDGGGICLDARRVYDSYVSETPCSPKNSIFVELNTDSGYMNEEHRQ